MGDEESKRSNGNDEFPFNTIVGLGTRGSPSEPVILTNGCINNVVMVSGNATFHQSFYQDAGHVRPQNELSWFGAPMTSTPQQRPEPPQPFSLSVTGTTEFQSGSVKKLQNTAFDFDRGTAIQPNKLGAQEQVPWRCVTVRKPKIVRFLESPPITHSTPNGNSPQIHTRSIPDDGNASTTTPDIIPFSP